MVAPGFAGGGYTGNVSTRAIAGFVHGQEFVSTAETTANPDNRRALEYMHRGGVRGYANGGFVNPDGPTYVRGTGGSTSGSSSATRVGEVGEVRETVLFKDELHIDGMKVGEWLRQYVRLYKGN